MSLTAADILKHTGDMLRREVQVTDWNGSVWVRGMTVREFEIQQSTAGGKNDDGKSSARMVARCAIDANGDRLFKDEQIDLIAELPLKQMMELTNAISALSGLIEDEKNEKADPGKSLGSSPEPSLTEPDSGSPAT